MIEVWVCDPLPSCVDYMGALGGASVGQLTSTLLGTGRQRGKCDAFVGGLGSESRAIDREVVGR